MFSAAPMVANTSTAPGRTNVQKFNGTFVARVLNQVSSAAARNCLRSSIGSTVTVTTYESGAVRFGGSCGAVLQDHAPQAVSASTGSVTLSAVRVLAMALADEHFNTSRRLQSNDRDLSHYDIEVYDQSGAIRVAFLPPPSTGKGSETLGCPETGPIAVTYIVNPNTLQVQAGNLVC